MTPSSLDDFSQDFFTHLFAVYPEWSSFASAEPQVHGRQDYLVVRVPAPPPALNRWLVITTDNREVTVGLDIYHAHFEWPSDESDHALNPMAFIAAILDETLAAAQGWNGDKWTGSWVYETDKNISLPDHSLTRVVVKSWNGTFDREIFIT